MDDAWRLRAPVTVAESLALLDSVPLGRIGFTSKALPVIRPVNHIVDDGAVVIRSHDGAAIVSAARPAEGGVVAYEADAIGPAGHLAWSVVVTGMAHLVTDRHEAARYRGILRAWEDGQPDYIVRISPELVTGFRCGCVVEEESPERPARPSHGGVSLSGGTLCQDRTGCRRLSRLSR